MWQFATKTQNYGDVLTLVVRHRNEEFAGFGSTEIFVNERHDCHHE